jgi:tRNA threonylcarbamoyladenosine biosynthesis protein TsaB
MLLREGKVMKVLAIDTSTRVCCIALVDGERALGESLLYGQKNHSEKLLSMVDELFANTGVLPRSIDLIAVSSGPGSFTGLRVGISTAQGLAFSLGKDLKGVSTLEVLATQAAMWPGFICPMMDARKQQIYTCLYKYAENGTLTKVIGEAVIEPEKWLRDLPAAALFVGEGAQNYKGMIGKIQKGNTVLPDSHANPRALVLARIARQGYEQNRINELEETGPLYIRQPDAQANKNIRKGSFSH